MLVKIKNASMAGKKSLKVPFTKFDFSVAEVLTKSKFIENVEKKGKGSKRIMVISLKQGEKSIQEVKFWSKSSRRFYVGYKDLRPVRQGYGISVLSTPKGVMSNREARRLKVGGELLFEVW